MNTNRKARRAGLRSYRGDTSAVGRHARKLRKAIFGDYGRTLMAHFENKRVEARQ